MDEIEKRLRETSENCFNCYEAWQKNKKDAGARESLLESIHEIRKVASRLEIELAISERDEMALRPIPIPPHRDAQRRSQQDAQDDDNGNGNRFSPDEQRQFQAQSHHQQPRQQHGGGGGHQRRNNRPSRGKSEGQ